MKPNKVIRNKYIQRTFWIVLILILWEATATFGAVSPLLLPRVEDVAKTLWDALTNGSLGIQTLYSLGIIAAGMAISIVLAVLLSLLSMRYSVAESLIDTLVSIAHPLPGLAVLPLIIIWFGLSTATVIVLIVHSALWPILLNMKTGLRAVPRIYSDVGRNLSMKPLRITWEILLRASFGYTLSGMKIAWARAWRALIATEMAFGAIGAVGGIGWYIFKERTFMNTPALYASIIVVVAVGMLVEDLLFSHWKNAPWANGAQTQNSFDFG